MNIPISFDVTQTGLIVIPITMILLVALPDLLLPWAFLLAPFQAASALNVYLSGYPIGIQPGYLAAAFFIASLLLRVSIKDRIRVPRGLVYLCLPLIAFAGYVVLSGALLPHIFENAVKVFPPRGGIELSNLVLLQPSMTNVSQTAYAVFLVAFAVAVPLYVANFGGRWSARYYLVSYVLAGSLVAFVGFYQLAAAYLGLPYPYDLLYSSPTYGLGYEQTLEGGIKRLSSTFTEPSFAAFYLVGAFAFLLWYYLSVPRSRLVYLFCVVSGIALLLTTSTTAYLAMCVMVVLIVWYAVLRRGISYRIVRLSAIVALVVGMPIALAYLFDAFGTVGSVAEQILLEKDETASYEERMGTVLHSLALLWPTGGFGVGWGGNRPSSLLLSVLSNAGLWGSMLLAWFGVRVYRRAAAVAEYAPGKTTAAGPEWVHLMKGFGLSVLAMLIAGTIAVPDLATVSLWLNVGVLMALILEVEKRCRRSSAALAQNGNEAPRNPTLDPQAGKGSPR